MTKSVFITCSASLLVSMALFTAVTGCSTTTTGSPMNIRSSSGTFAPGQTPPPGQDAAAVCDPGTSGPRQWPMNVGTARDFYPDPKQTPVVTVGKKKLTIVVYGGPTPYPK